MCNSCVKHKVSEKKQTEGWGLVVKCSNEGKELFEKVKRVLTHNYGVVYPEAVYPVILVDKPGMAAKTRRHKYC
jgi:hypothetical protein